MENGQIWKILKKTKTKKKNKKKNKAMFFSWAVKTGDNEIFRKRFQNVLVTFH